MWLLRRFLLILLVTPFVAGAAEPQLLSADSFSEFGEHRGVVLLGLNWNRMWNCGGYENAQLQEISFTLLDPGDAEVATSTLDFRIPGRLRKSDYFTEYEILLTPGEYALSSFDIKVAESASRVRHLVTGAEQLIKEGEALGGTFSIANGEILYIGHFELDCVESPIPWRYYIDSRERFRSFVTRFWSEYPFLVNTPVQFRLFSTTRFGLPFALEETPDD
jgi:hypothetical protein